MHNRKINSESLSLAMSIYDNGLIRNVHDQVSISPADKIVDTCKNVGIVLI